MTGRYVENQHIVSHSKILTEVVANVLVAHVTSAHVTNKSENVVDEDERRCEGWFVEVLVNEREAIKAPGSFRLLSDLFECIAEHDNIISNT